MLQVPRGGDYTGNAFEIPAFFQAAFHTQSLQSSQFIFIAHALGYGIHTQGETVEELRLMVKDAVVCHFEDLADRPQLIRLHFVRDEALSL